MKKGLTTQNVKECKALLSQMVSYTTFKLSDIKSRRRGTLLVDERQRIAKYLYAHGYTYSVIGLAMNRDHTSIMHLVRKR